VDAPDPDLVDSNCDGIDGDLSASVFLAPGGDDGAAGTLEEPVRTIERALALAAEQGKPAVLIASGTYHHCRKLDVRLAASERATWSKHRLPWRSGPSSSSRDWRRTCVTTASVRTSHYTSRAC
jgi:hypothetical protein